MTVSRTPFDERSSCRSGLYLITRNPYKIQLSEIRTRKPSKRAATDPRFRTRCTISLFIHSNFRQVSLVHREVFKSVLTYMVIYPYFSVLCYEKLINKTKANCIWLRVLVCTVRVRIVTVSIHLKQSNYKIPYKVNSIFFCRKRQDVCLLAGLDRSVSNDHYL